jgi:hypothetical protein
MDDVKTDTDDSTPQAQAPAKDEHREKLPAEKTFDKAVYTGISYFAQGVAGIILARWLAFGKGKPHFDKMAEWLGPRMFPKKPLEKAVKETNAFIITTTQIAAGTAFIPPVKALEDRKPEIVRSLHEKHVASKEAQGRPYTDEEKAHHEQCLQALEKEPKQSWGSLMEARVASLAGVYGVLFALGNERNEKLREFVANPITKGIEKIGFKEMAKSKTFAQYMQLSAVEVFYSAVSAGGLYVWSHFVRPPKKEAIDTNKDPVQPATTQSENTIPEHTDTPTNLFQDRVKQQKNLGETMPAPEALYTHKLAAEPDNNALLPSM